VLLDVPQINQITGSDAMTVVKSYDQMPGDEGASYSDPTCAGAVFNTVQTAYKGSHYVATRGSALNEPGEQFRHYVDEGVVSFGSGHDAREFLSTSHQVWGRCVGKHVIYTPTDGKPGTWTMRTPVTAGGVTAAVVDKEAGDGYTCSHGITAKSNVVIDVSACGYNIADQGVTVVSTLVNAIAGRFPA
jgi:serine/threonine-protein kinase